MPQRSVTAQRFTREGEHYVRAVIDHPDYEDYLVYGPLAEADARVLARLLDEIPCDITYNGSGPYGLDGVGEQSGGGTFAFSVGQDVRIKYGDCRGETGTVRDRWFAGDGAPAYLLYVDQGSVIQTGIFAQEQLEQREEHDPTFTGLR